MRNLEENIRQLIPSEVALDALLVCADKPTNYTGVRNSLFTYQDLWMVVKSFAAARSHPPQAIAEAILSIQGATSEAGEKLPDMMSYEGVEPKSGTPGAGLYNARQRFSAPLMPLSWERLN